MQGVAVAPLKGGEPTIILLCGKCLERDGAARRLRWRHVKREAA